MKVNLAELREISNLEVDAVPKDPLLRRLHAGQCIRQNCESALYDVSIAFTSEEEWPEIERRILSAVEYARISSSSDPAPLTSRSRIFIAMGCVALVLAGFFLIRQWIYGYPIPLLQKRRTFPASSVDPVSALTPIRSDWLVTGK